MFLMKKYVTYFAISDIFAKLGGYKALIDPLFMATFPFFTLSYLHKLSRIIKQTRMKEYVNELKTIAFALHMKLRSDKELCKRITAEYPEKEERIKVLLWNFIKLKFKYALAKKLDYNFSELSDIEEYYDEVFEIYLLRFEHFNFKK